MLPAFALIALSAAPFEGVLTYEVRLRNASGTVTTYVAKAGVRSEAHLPFNGTANDVTVLVKAEAPEVSLVWDQKTKAFAPQASPPPKRQVTRAEAQGELSVQGLKCKRVRLHDDEGGLTDYCLAAEVLGDKQLERLLAKAQRLDEQTLAALASAGGKGLVVKLMHTLKGGEVDLTMELSSLERRKLEPTLFR